MPSEAVKNRFAKRQIVLKIQELGAQKRTLTALFSQQQSILWRSFGEDLQAAAMPNDPLASEALSSTGSVGRAAGVPDEIYSLDMRSGGATEADHIPEITDRMFDDAGGWADPKMKDRYRRRKQDNANRVVQLRQWAREMP